MKFKDLKLQIRLLILIILIIIIAVGLSSFLVSQRELSDIQDKIETNILNICNVVANTPTIQNGLYEKDTRIIQDYTINILARLDEAEIITVADMNGIRYGHKNPFQLGKKFVGGDEEKVIEKAETYTSVATGTLGTSVRAFAPVFYNDLQVGFVMTGHLYNDVLLKRRNLLINLSIYTLIGIVIGVIGAVTISLDIKKDLLGLEPTEIVRLYREKKAILSSIREGIISVDKQGMITLANDSALKILNLNKDVIGKDIKKVFPSTRLVEVVKSGEPEFNREQKVEDSYIVTNRIPIWDEDRIIGALATFKDRTEAVQMAEEITGIKQIVNALRANTHEFMNKIHVIMGLLELGEYKKAKEYIIRIKKYQEKIHQIILNNIKNPTVSALLLGKVNRSKELRIQFNISKESKIHNDLNWHFTESLIIVIGNLIENAFDSIQRAQKQEEGWVKVLIRDTGKDIVLEVQDNGEGISVKDQKKIFNYGFSSKKESSGIGLYLVKNTIKRLGGEIHLESELDSGSIFTITIPKEVSK